ncbi:MAG: insulinase family protein [Clostridiales Family XIII bacterium]|jgi:predicted Zn-dependent peptidase|nr:insulinase family protein [Clostridiales Family XIII bacterium]
MIDKYQLGNGITVVTEYLPHSASVSAGIWVRAGAVDEDDRCAGISHFIEHMLFKGTHSRTYRQISEDVEKLGGHMNAFTGKEGTCFYVRCLSDHLIESVSVLADMVTDSLFDPAEMEKEKGVIIEEIKMIEDVPDDWGFDLIQEAIFKGGSLARRIIGTKESVSAITQSDILSYMARRYTADGVVISVCGKFDADALKGALEGLFGGITGTAPARVHVPDAEAYPRESVVRDIEQTHLFLGTKGLCYSSDDIFVLDLYSSLLGGGMSSRLFTAVREEQGLAYSVYSSHTPYVDDGQFVVYAGVADEKAEAALAAIQHEITRLAEGGVSGEELARAREQYKGAFIFRRENSSSRMFMLGRNQLLLGRIYTEEEILAGADAVTAADILRMAGRFADFARYAAVSISGRGLDLQKIL